MESTQAAATFRSGLTTICKDIKKLTTFTPSTPLTLEKFEEVKRCIDNLKELAEGLLTPSPPLDPKEEWRGKIEREIKRDEEELRALEAEGDRLIKLLEVQREAEANPYICSPVILSLGLKVSALRSSIVEGGKQLDRLK
jgi:hypothetical protein